MGKVQVGRAVSINEPIDTVRDRLLSFARLYEWKLTEDAGNHFVFKRGGALGNVMSFDVQKVTSTLEVDLTQSEAVVSVIAQLTAGSLLQVFTAGDRNTLERQMDVFVGTLKGG